MISESGKLLIAALWIIAGLSIFLIRGFYVC